MTTSILIQASLSPSAQPQQWTCTPQGGWQYHSCSQVVACLIPAQPQTD